MGTDIHSVIEIRKNKIWQPIDELPDAFNQRDYSIFALIAGIDDYFDRQTFEIKGLPEDISGKRFYFESETPRARERYENEGTTMCVFPDGTFTNPSDKRLEKKITEEEYKKLRVAQKKEEYDHSRYGSLGKVWDFDAQVYVYTVEDASVLDGIYKEVPYKEIYQSFEDYMNDIYADDWNEDAGDYGRYEVDFESEDYHSFSYITLQEMVNADYSKYTLNKCKVPRFFYDAFIREGGVLPKGFINEDAQIIDIRSAISETLSPNVMIAWPMTDSEMKELEFFKTIDEMKDLAAKYNVENYDNIRVVFAFDN